MSAKLLSRARPASGNLLLRPRAYQSSSRVSEPSSEHHSQPDIHNTTRPLPSRFPAHLAGRPQTLSKSSWRARRDEPFSTETVQALFDNKISSLQVDGFLSPEECARMVQVIKTHQMDSYSDKVYPPIGCVGITQFDKQESKSAYFSAVTKAQALQQRFIREAGVDVTARVLAAFRRVAPPGFAVRLAQEDGEDGPMSYFAGLLRMINRSALIHADYGGFDGPGWEIGRITAQLTWNVLLDEVQGGESVVHRRFWQGSEDDARFKMKDSYGYDPAVVGGAEHQVLRPKVGQLSLFNPRNFHEVMAIENPERHPRYTFSSFIGFLPATEPSGPALIFWS